MVEAYEFFKNLQDIFKKMHEEERTQYIEGIGFVFPEKENGKEKHTLTKKISNSKK